MRNILLVVLLVLFLSNNSFAKPALYDAWGSKPEERPSLTSGWREVIKPPDGKVDATAAEKKKGYIVFSKHYLEIIYSNMIPDSYEKTDELKMLVTKGEYEPISFAVYALKHLSNVKVSVSDLKSKEGTVISKDNIDIRLVEPTRVKGGAPKTYRMYPFYLVKESNVNVAANTNKQFWLTVYIPKKSKPGAYEGKITVKPVGNQATSIKLVIRVPSFELIKQKTQYGLGAYLSDDDAMLEKQCIDLAAHGNTNVSVGVKGPGYGMSLPLCKKLIKQQLRMMKKYNMTGLSLIKIGLNRVIKTWDHGMGWFYPFHFTPEIDRKFLDVAKATKEAVKEAGWTYPWAWDAAHEVGGNLSRKKKGYPDLKQMSRHYLDLLKRHHPDITTSAYIGGGLRMGLPEDEWWKDVDCFYTNYLLGEPEKTMKRLKAGGRHRVGIYNMASHGNKPVVERHFLGFFTWKLKPAAAGQWIYFFDTLTKNMVRGNEGYTARSKIKGEGHIPSISWEAIREGIDDMRYISTLEYYMKKHAKNSGKKKYIKKAEALLEELRKEVPTNADSYDAFHGAVLGTVAPSQYDKWRMKIAVLISKLSKK